jgi:hypothetical protein
MPSDSVSGLYLYSRDIISSKIRSQGKYIMRNLAGRRGGVPLRQFAGIRFSAVLETEIECTKITLPFTKNALLLPWNSHGGSSIVTQGRQRIVD